MQSHNQNFSEDQEPDIITNEICVNDENISNKEKRIEKSIPNPYSFDKIQRNNVEFLETIKNIQSVKKTIPNASDVLNDFHFNREQYKLIRINQLTNEITEHLKNRKIDDDTINYILKCNNIRRVESTIKNDEKLIHMLLSYKKLLMHHGKENLRRKLHVI